MTAHSPAATRYGWPAVLWSVTTNAPFPRGTRQPALVVTPVPGGRWKLEVASAVISS